MSDQQYLFIGHNYDRGKPAKMIEADFIICYGRMSIYRLIDKYPSFELYTIGERCDQKEWKKYWEDHKSEFGTKQEYAEYQRLKAKFEK